MKKDKLLPIALIGLLGLGFYYISTQQQQVRPPQVPPGYGPTTLPNGQTAWVNTAGIAVNALGQLLGPIQTIIEAIKQGKAVPGITGCGCKTRPAYRTNERYVL